MMKLSAEEKFALEQARKNGYLVVDKCRCDWEAWPYRQVWEIWVEECLIEGKPLVWVVRDVQTTLIMFDIEGVPFRISPEGVDLLAQVVQPYPNVGYPWIFCMVPDTDMDSVARQMVTIAQEHGRLCFGHGSLIAFLMDERGKGGPLDMRPIFSWADDNRYGRHIPRYEPGFRERKHWGMVDAYRTQSLEEVAERGYVIARRDSELWSARQNICAEKSLPLVGITVTHETRCQLVLLMSTTHNLLTPEGMTRAHEVCARYADSHSLILPYADGVVCSSIPIVHADEVAREMFRIAQTYVCDALVEPEGDPE